MKMKWIVGAAAAVLLAAGTGTGAAQSAGVTFVPQVDKLTDANASYAGVKDVESGGEFRWTCMGKGGTDLTAVYAFNRVIPPLHGLFIQGEYRFDTQPSQKTMLWVLPGNQSAHIGPPAPPGRPDKTTTFTQAALVAQQLIIRAINDRDGSAVTSTFPLTGLQAALDQLSCKVKK